MAAAEHLNRRLFHGTAHVFAENETIEPRYSPALKTDVTFATDSEEMADYYAGATAARQGKLFGPVYEVEPVDPKESNADIPLSNTHRGMLKGPREFLPYNASWNQTEYVVSKKGFKPKNIVGWGINTNISGKGFPY